MNEDIKRAIKELARQNGGELPTLVELNKYMNDQVKKQNNLPTANLEGYSSEDIFVIVNGLWGDASPIRLKTLSEKEFGSIPLLCQIRQLMATIKKDGKIKLTSIGNIPPKIVAELYELGIPEHLIEDGYSKLSNESDSIGVQLAHIMAILMKIIKVQKGVMTLTKSGEKMVNNPQKLLNELLCTFCGKYNFGCFDSFPYPNIGGLGSGFSLLLVAKYGSEKMTDKFYASRYFETFPQLLEGVNAEYGSIESATASCYSTRTFERFMRHFGLIEMERERKPDAETYIIKTSLFDKMFEIELR